jgi:hypothetical protein
MDLNNILIKFLNCQHLKTNHFNAFSCVLISLSYDLLYLIHHTQTLTCYHSYLGILILCGTSFNIQKDSYHSVILWIWYCYFKKHFQVSKTKVSFPCIRCSWMIMYYVHITERENKIIGLTDVFLQSMTTRLWGQS